MIPAGALLVMVVCSPAGCEQQAWQWLGPAPCESFAPALIAQWAGEHPGLRVTGWRCVTWNRETPA